MELEGSLPCSKQSADSEALCDFYSEELFVLRPTPKLEDHPLSPLRDCIFDIYSQLPSISGGRLPHPQAEDVLRRGDTQLHSETHKLLEELRTIS